MGYQITTYYCGLALWCVFVPANKSTGLSTLLDDPGVNIQFIPDGL